MSDAYQDFLARKTFVAPPTGFEPVGLPDYLFPFQKDLVRWALRRGRAALFAAVGLGKTRMQLEFAAQASAYQRIHQSTRPEALILTPLAVASQTVREAAAIGISASYCREPDQVRPGIITVTNYDRLDKFNLSRVGVIVLDESSVLKHETSKRRDQLVNAFRSTPFRLACTATPAPNDRKELGNHAEFLGLCTMQEMLSAFFVHDSGNGVWRLKGHARDAFYAWVATWGAVVSRPSDLGYPDDGYLLPPLRIHDHVIAATLEQDRAVAETRAAKQLNLIPQAARGLKAQRKARRVTLQERVDAAVSIVLAESEEQWCVWCELNDESNALEEAIVRAIPGAVAICGSDKAETKEAAMLGFADGTIRVIVTKPRIAGFGLNWQRCARACFVGVSNKFEEVHQALGRNHRFGQTREVHAHFVYSELEGDVRANLARKMTEFREMTETMRGYISAAVRDNVCGLVRSTTPYVPTVPMAIPEWLTANVEAA